MTPKSATLLKIILGGKISKMRPAHEIPLLYEKELLQKQDKM